MKKKLVTKKFKGLAVIAVILGSVSAYLIFDGDGFTPEQLEAQKKMSSVQNNQLPTMQAPQQQERVPTTPARRNISVTAEDLSSEVVVRAVNPNEALQHAELALSLRNQQMQTRRASLLAEQRKAELEALKHQSEFRKVQFSDEKDRQERSQQEVVTATLDNLVQASLDGPVQPPALPVREKASLESFRVVGIFKSNSEWVARISRGGAIQRIKSDYILDGDIHVAVFEDRVRLTRGKEVVELYL